MDVASPLQAKILKRLAAGATVSDDFGVHFDDRNLSKRHDYDGEDESNWGGPKYETLNEGVCQPLNICIMITGTRGDVQPFVAIGMKLKVRQKRFWEGMTAGLGGPRMPGRSPLLHKGVSVSFEVLDADYL